MHDDLPLECRSDPKAKALLRQGYRLSVEVSYEAQLQIGDGEPKRLPQGFAAARITATHDHRPPETWVNVVHVIKGAHANR